MKAIIIILSSFTIFSVQAMGPGAGAGAGAGGAPDAGAGGAPGAGAGVPKSDGPPPPSGEGGHKYELEIQKVLPMNDTDFVVFKGLKVKRYNRTFFVADGQFAVKNDFNDDWEIEAWCWRSQLGNNQWELTPYKAPRQPISEFIENIYIENIQKDVAPYSDLPVYTRGDKVVKVFPGGLYTVTNYVADVSNFPPSMQDGTYRIEIFLYTEGVCQSGFIIYWKVYPEVG